MGQITSNRVRLRIQNSYLCMVKLWVFDRTAYVINVFLLFVHAFGVHMGWYGVRVWHLPYCCPSLAIKVMQPSELP